MDNNLNLTPEMLEQVKSASSAAALLTLAQENGITLTAEQAAVYYAQLHPEIGALSDEELDNVSGGGACNPPSKCDFCGWTEFEYKESGGDWISHYSWFCKKCGRIDR